VIPSEGALNRSLAEGRGCAATPHDWQKALLINNALSIVHDGVDDRGGKWPEGAPQGPATFFFAPYTHEELTKTNARPTGK